MSGVNGALWVSDGGWREQSETGLWLWAGVREAGVCKESEGERTGVAIVVDKVVGADGEGGVGWEGVKKS